MTKIEQLKDDINTSSMTTYEKTCMIRELDNLAKIFDRIYDMANEDVKAYIRIRLRWDD